MNLLHRFQRFLAAPASAPSPTDKGKQYRLYQKAANLHYNPRLYRADAGINEWRQALNLALYPPYFDRAPLYRLYDQALLDDHLFAQIETRKNGSLAEPFMLYRNGQDDPEAVELLHNKWLTDLMGYILDARFWGYSVVEFDADDLKANQAFTKVEWIHPIYINPKRGVFLPDPLNQANAIALSDPLVANWTLCFGHPDDFGRLMRPTRRVIYKDFTFSDWARYNEKYGVPYTVLNTAARDEKELDQYQAMLENFGSNGWGIIDEADKLSSLDVDGQGRHENFLQFIKENDTQISKSIVGQTATADEKSFVGSAEVQERKLDWYVEADMYYLQNAINGQVLPFLIKKGYPLEGLRFGFTLFEERKRQRSTSDTENQNLRLSPSEKSVEEALRTLAHHNPFQKGCCH